MSSGGFRSGSGRKKMPYSSFRISVPEFLVDDVRSFIIFRLSGVSMTDIIYNSIKANIDKFLLDPDLQETYFLLNKCLDFVRESKFDDFNNFIKSDIESYVFSEFDALDSGEVKQDTVLWNDIRYIQHDILNYFEL